MKGKLYKIISVGLGLLLVAGGATACEKHAHHVNNWKVKTPATCMSEGLEEGICPDCGTVVEQAIPVDENAHAYGLWQVSAPTESATGTATKICNHNQEHTLTQSLPVLSDEAYRVKVLKEPGAFEKGESRYTYTPQAEGLEDIVFTVVTAETGVHTVKDAIEAALRNKKLVREGEGEVCSARGQSPVSTFWYEYGNDYCHIKDNADNVERWYSREDGVFYGVVNDPKISVPLYLDVQGKEPYLNGYFHRFQYADVGESYGAEGLINVLYTFEMRNNNLDFHEEVTERDGQTYYSYSYSYLTGNTYYSFVDVTFTLSDSYALKTVEAKCKQYTKDSFSYDKDTGLTTLTDPDGFNYDAFITFEQTLVSELSEEEQADVPKNPYGKESRNLKSFRIRGGTNNVFDDDPDEKITLNADVASTLYIEDIQPQFADLTLDPIKSFHLVQSGRDVYELNLNTMGSRGVMMFQNQNNKKAVTLRSQIAGEVTLSITTESGFRKEFTVFVKPKAPSSITPSAYLFRDTGSAWFTDPAPSDLTVYTGQSVLLRALPQEDEKAYVDVSCTVTASPAQNVSLTEIEFEGQTVSKFVASQAGTYTVTLTTKLGSVSRSVIITVREAPTPQEIFTGTYQVTVNDMQPMGTFKLEITPSGDGTQGTMVLTDPRNTTQNLSYTYTPNADNPTFAGTLVLQHMGGVTDMDVTIAVNEAFALELTYTTRFKDSNGEYIKKTVNLSRA